MAGPQQYTFPQPPPPPPGPPPGNQHSIQPQYGYTPQQSQYQHLQQQQQHQHQQRGSGAARGGRGGNQGGRGEYHGIAPYNPRQPSGGYDPRHPHQGQAPGPPAGFNGPNNQQISSPYPVAPNGPSPQQGHGVGGYPPVHWQGNQHGPPHGPSQHPQQPPMHHPHPATLSVQNFHPNYAPQPYQQAQYGQHQHPQFQAPYGHSVPQNQSLHPPAPQIVPPQQWQGPHMQNRPQFNNHRGRGGYNNNARGSNDPPAPLMGPPIRMGFDNDRGGGHLAQASHGFPPHANHHSPNSFSQSQFQGCPPDFFQAGHRSSLDSVPYNNNTSHKGRGGDNSNYRSKGRGDFQQHQFRGRNDGRHHQNNGHKSTSENYHKPAGADANGKKKKKRRTNTLGLTPNGVDHEHSDDEVDDVDEEARLVTLLGPDTPQLPTDLEAWLAERKNKFPTKARREAASEQIRLAREQGRDLGKKKKENGDKVIRKEEGESKLEKQKRKAEKLRLELEKAERKIQQEISGSKRKRENGDEGDDDRGQVSNEDSDSTSGSDSDEKPETFSSRPDTSTRLPPQPKAQLQRHCKYFSTGGTCGKKGKCRFVHDQEVRNQALRDKEANGGKMTLAQRLILNDTAKDDLTILKSIKYLKEKGLMPDQLTSSATTYEDETQMDDAENIIIETSSYGEN